MNSNSKNIEQNAEKQVVINVQSAGKPVEVTVKHVHVWQAADTSPLTPLHPTMSPLTPLHAPVSPSEAGAVAGVLRDGSTIRLCVSDSALADDGSAGTFIGVRDGKIVADMAGSSADTLFKVKLRSKEGEPATYSLVSHAAKYLRVTKDGEVDCAGGGGRWTLFRIEPMTSGVSIASVANQGKPLFHLGVIDGSLSGQSAPNCFLVSEVEEQSLPKAASAPKKLTPDERAAKKAERLAKKEAAKVTGEERAAQKLARQEARLATKESKKESKKEMLLSDWVEVPEKSSKKNKPVNEVAKAKAKASKMPAESVIKAVKLENVPSFPLGEINLRPLNFLEAQNRKSTVGWNVGISPFGYVVPDASSGSWGTLIATPNSAKSAVFLIASHTESFRLAIGKNGLVSHKGGSGLFAQFEPVKHGKFYSFRCVGHKEAPKFLALSTSGVLYAASDSGKDTRFLLARPNKASEEN